MASGHFPHALLVTAAATLGGFSIRCTDDPIVPPVSVEDGRRLYADTCALCHGAKGEGYAADNATALANPRFLESASDEFLRRSIARGRSGTTMSAWSTARGGPHNDTEIRSIVAFLRKWQTSPFVPEDPRPATGDVVRGSWLYGAQCQGCHGATGTEGPYVRLANADFLASASDGFLRHAIEKGRPGTKMPSFESRLDGASIDDLVVLLRSWQKPTSDGVAPIPGTLGPIVLNEGGRDPAFELGRRFTGADEIKRALDHGAAIGFLDARPPADYAAEHIAGANSVPFYAADDYLFALPRDKWLVCYCACPHAESGRLLDTLLANGFTKATILDEGFFVWKQRGYPTRVGPLP